jgi:hypothetical protein
MRLACKVRAFATLDGFNGRLDELLKAFVVDVGGRPLGNLVPREAVPELHVGLIVL